jgi:endonuclease I
MRKFFCILQLFLLLSFLSFGQIPSGYYDSANGKTGAELKTALSYIIDDHTQLSYSALWSAFQYTDKKPNGKVWDMYSDIPGGTPPYEYTFVTNQCGNYSGERSCYNREHSLPKSWFNDATPMYSDLFHLVPTDGYVNGKRSNFPFGRVGNASWTSLNGSKLGTSNYPGYSGVVFEPIDEYKGDFARGYFYMVTRYQSRLSSWSSPMLDKSSYPAFTEWALNLLVEWHNADPVSEKEINRNNAVYSYQQNRNPFIDHPEFVGKIWGMGVSSLSFTSSPSISVIVGNQYSYSVSSSGGNGNSIVITCPVKPSWITFSGGSNGTATLSGTPTEADQGQHNVKLIATDGETSVEQSYLISVQVNTLELVFTSAPVTSAFVNQQYSYTVKAKVDGDPSAIIDFEGVEIPSWLTFTDQQNGTAILYGTPNESNIGNSDIEIKAISDELEAMQSFAIQVGESGSGSEFIETFSFMPATSSSYSNRSWKGDNDFNWTATNARTDEQIDGRAICFKNEGEPYLLSQTLSGGVSSVSFKHQQKYTGSGGTITLFINNQQFGEPVVVSSTVNTATFSNIDVTNDFTIKLVSNGLSRIAIDNLAWTNLVAQPQIPVFGIITHSPSNPNLDQVIDFSAEVSDLDGTISSVTLHYGNTSGSYDNEITMDHAGENLYSISSVMPLVNGNVYYVVAAVDNQGFHASSPEFTISAPPKVFTLEISINGSGSVSVNGAPYSSALEINEGTSISLLAIPHQGFQFEGWTGDLNSLLAEENIQLTSNKNITATFSVISSVFPKFFNDLVVYPNPFSESISLSSIEKIFRVTFVDLAGQTVLISTNPDQEIQTSNLMPGVYLLKIENNFGESTYRKIVKL